MDCLVFIVDSSYLGLCCIFSVSQGKLLKESVCTCETRCVETSYFCCSEISNISSPSFTYSTNQVLNLPPAGKRRGIYIKREREVGIEGKDTVYLLEEIRKYGHSIPPGCNPQNNPSAMNWNSATSHCLAFQHHTGHDQKPACISTRMWLL